MERLFAKRCAKRRGRRRGLSEDVGFTVIEVLIVIVVLPLVVGGITTAIITTLRDESGLSNQLSDSHDAQFSASYYVRDVQSAAKITTDASLPQCGATTGTQILGLVLLQPTTGTTTFVSYVQTASPEVVRNYCPSPGASPTSTVVSNDVSNTVPNPAIATPTTNAFTAGSTAATECSPTTSSALIPSFCIANVTLSITERKFTAEHQPFTYSLTASPRQLPSGTGGVPSGSSPSLLLLGSGVNLNCSGSGTGGLGVNGVAAVDSTSTSTSNPPGPPVKLGEAISASNVYSPEGSSALDHPGDYTQATTQPYSTGPSVPDPYLDLPDPSPSTDPTYNTIQPSTTSLQGGPGIYQHQVNLTNASGSQMNIPSGIYIFEGGLTISGNSSTIVSSSPGGGVMFFIGTPNAPPGAPQPASYTVSGQGTVTLNSMTSAIAQSLGVNPIYAGVVIFQSRTDSQPLAISGNGSSAALTYGGVVYAPFAQVVTQGNGKTQITNVVSTSLLCGGNGAVSVGPVSTAPNVTVSSSVNPAIPGQPVTFTATVTDPVNGYVPLGTVTFTQSPGGATLCPAVALNNGKATCTTSALAPSASPYPITATFNPPSGTVSYATSSGTLSPGETVTNPVISNITPTPAPSGTQVTINGSGFSGSSQVNFGPTVIPSSSLLINGAGTQISFSAPAGSGTVSVSVVNGGVTSNSVQFTYLAVTGIVKTPAPAGTPVTINGSGFSGASQVNFGPTVIPSSSLLINGAGTQISFPAPAGSGTVSVSVVNGGLTSNSVQFTYFAVTGINPSSAPSGTSVTITGTGLTGTSSITFGSTTITTGFTVNGAGTQITLPAPANPSAGTVNVTVTNNGFTSSPVSFTYLCQITGFNPATGKKNTAITGLVIQGSGFSGATKVTWNGVSITPFTVNAAGTTITLNVPGLPMGTYPVTVTAANGQVANSTFQYK